MRETDAERLVPGTRGFGFYRLSRRATILIVASAGLALAGTVGPSIAARNEGHHYTDEEIAGLFASTCGFCHSDGGRMAGKGPQLMGTKRSDAFIINRIKHGKESRMPAFGEVLSDAEIKGIVHYIRDLKPD